MRKIYILLLLVLLTGCTKEEVMTFDTDYAALNIWVGTEAGAVYENVTYNYSYAYEEGDVTFYAQISGMPSDKDRVFHLEPFGGDSAIVANSIRTEDYVIKAGETGGKYNVHFSRKKLADESLFTQKDGTIYFRMVEDGVFAKGTEKHQEFCVALKNYLAKPSSWEKANYPKVALSKYFGSYSISKYQFMIEVLGLVDFSINYNMTKSYDEETNTISASYAVYLRQKMQEALNEYNSTHDTPLTDEQGIAVTF
jgi:hypothetical protein